MFLQAILATASVSADWIAPIEPQREYCVTGAVTYVCSWLACTANVADPADPNGSVVYASGQLPGRSIGELIGCDRLTVGDLVEIHGHGEKLLLEPGLSVRSMRRIGSVDLPQPREFTWSELAAGLANNRRARVSGVLRSVVPTTDHGRELFLLTLGMRDGVLVLRVPGGRNWKEWVDAEITADGVVLPLINNRFEFIRPELETADADAIRMVSPPPTEIPEVRIDGAMSRRLKTYDHHRCRVVGMVTGRSSGGMEFSLQRKGTALAVRGLAPAPAVGECVEAVGFPQMEDDVAGLVSSEWRESAAEITAEPMRLSLKNLAKSVGMYHEYYPVDICNRLVCIRAELSTAPFSDGSTVYLDLIADGCAFKATISSPEGDELLEKLRDEPLVDVQGVLHLVFARSEHDARYRSLKAVEVRLRTTDDIKVIPDAGFRWRRIRRHGATVAVWVLALSLGGVLWQLYRLSRRRMRKQVLMEDRRRIAQDLHDSIAQHMSGVKLLLDTVLGCADTLPEAQRTALGMADCVMTQARSELREAILNLQNDDLMEKTFPELAEKWAAELEASGKVRIRLALRGSVDALTPECKRDLLAIVKEAATNAISHGGAKNIAVVSDPLAAGGFTMGIWNDGAPFDAASVPGPEAGHFGLSGIRERALRCGFAAVFSDNGKWRGIELKKEERR